MFKKIIIFAAIIALLFATPIMATEGTSSDENEADLAAIVNGEKITISELDQFANMQQLIMSLYQSNQQFTQLLLQTEAGQDLLNEFRKTKLDGMITMELLKKEAEKRNIELSEEEKDEMFNQQLASIKQNNNLTDDQLLSSLNEQGISSLEEYKGIFLENNKDNLVLNKLMQEVTKEVSISDEEAKEYYNNNKNQYEYGEQVNASHILLEDEEKVEEVLNKVNNGQNFAELAEEYSQGPTAEDGGKLGFFEKGDMVPAFEEKAFDLEVGEISEEAVKTDYGYHIIKVTDKKEAGVASFEEVKSNIKENLSNQQRQKAWDDFVNKLREEAEIEKKLD
ncbi:MAG: peptidylprolyl isomerase [Bacillota bacterium]